MGDTRGLLGGTGATVDPRATKKCQAQLTRSLNKEFMENPRHAGMVRIAWGDKHRTNGKMLAIAATSADSEVLVWKCHGRNGTRLG